MSSDNYQVPDPSSSLELNATSCKHQTQSMPRSHGLSTVQMHYRQKDTLQHMLHSYFSDCHCKGVYLLIHEDNQYFTINFNMSDASNSHFPPSDKDIVSAMCTALERKNQTSFGCGLYLSTV
ncbi:hypothetical protein AJ78_08794 [Emergomyces pasteurianus Ep9510]|uniref:Uncharacterized protein n=1 Tax=Emergomyces pasteurianus Ep9510 TaxID=1447872 RepID=A0A1J9PQA2_9EURO|nr:hypothetical protein AJ78_08794 [Emergomyces pasteurianus Ep9510]